MKMKAAILLLLTATLSFGQAVVNPSTKNAAPYYSSTSKVKGVAAPTTPNLVPEFWTSTPNSGSAVPAWALTGVPTNAQTGTTYTVAVTDRAKYLSFSNAASIAVTLPQAGSTGFASNFVFVTCDIGAGTATITPTTSTISYTNGSAYTSAAATLALTTGQCAWVYSDDTNYFAIVRLTTAGTTINATNNVIPRRSNATTFVDSAFTDAGTTVVSSEPIEVPSSSSTGIGTTSGLKLSFNANNNIAITQNNGNPILTSSSNEFELTNTHVIEWSTTGSAIASVDSSLSRKSAGLVQVGKGTAAATGSLAASGFQSLGTKFTASGCTNSATVGGGTAGQYTSGTTGTCTVTVTMGDTDTAPNGWACFANDETTGNLYRQTASTTTTATFSGTTVSGDVITFACIAY